MSDKQQKDQPVTDDKDPRFIALTSAERRDLVTHRIKQREAAMLGLWMDIVELEENGNPDSDMTTQIRSMHEQAAALGRVAKRLYDLAGGQTSL